MELGFWITIVSGIPDSFSFITDSKVQDYRCTSKNFLDSGIRIPLPDGGRYILISIITLMIIENRAQ